MTAIWYNTKILTLTPLTQNSILRNTLINMHMYKENKHTLLFFSKKGYPRIFGRYTHFSFNFDAYFFLFIDCDKGFRLYFSRFPRSDMVFELNLIAVKLMEEGIVLTCCGHIMLHLVWTFNGFIFSSDLYCEGVGCEATIVIFNLL